ncbi:MAG: MdtA/MuxA family multidrug efflux RND transporter periplasmic adaptor subunit [Bryobacteraceae bacterium]|jgi:multidrug efflux system membrane fusion protein
MSEYSRQSTPETVVGPAIPSALEGHRPVKTKKRSGWVWLVVLLAAGVAAYYLWPRGSGAANGNGQPAPSSAKKGGKGGIPPVVSIHATRGNIGVYVTGLASVTPINTVTVRSRVDGQLMSVNYKEGDIVKKDDPLIEIDPRPYQVALEQAEGNLTRDQALLDNAKVDQARYETLLKQNAIPEQQLATQKALVTQDEGVVKADQGAIDMAKLNLVYCHIAAPIGGRVGLRLVDPGNIVHAADTTGMIVITQLQPISVIFPVAEDQLPAVLSRWRAGQKLVVEAWDRADQRKIATGYLATIDNEIDQTTGTLRLRANFDNADYQLFPNQFVNAHMLVQEKSGVTLINNAAVQRSTNETYVWLLKPDSTVTVRDINTGTSEGDQTEVTSGLQPGDGVVMTGVDKLVEGARVVSQWGDQSPATGSGGGRGSRKSGGKGK